jgi:hypothetical protein
MLRQTDGRNRRDYFMHCDLIRDRSKSYPSTQRWDLDEFIVWPRFLLNPINPRYCRPVYVAPYSLNSQLPSHYIQVSLYPLVVNVTNP